MAKPRKRGRKWFLLRRFEKDHLVHRYEPLQRGELNKRKKEGWRVVDG
ncbi:hypothetical protein [Halalkalibacter oceani]